MTPGVVNTGKRSFVFIRQKKYPGNNATSISFVRSDHFLLDLLMGKKHSNPAFSSNIVAYFSLPLLARIANHGHGRFVMNILAPRDATAIGVPFFSTPLPIEAIFPCAPVDHAESLADEWKSVPVLQDIPSASPRQSGAYLNARWGQACKYRYRNEIGRRSLRMQASCTKPTAVG